MRGFSLVEISIVLVILGLLTGGILTGQSLIRAAEIRSVGTEYNRYVAATHTFRDKYMAIPGDMINATAFWNLQMTGSGCTSNTGKTTAGSPGTCDGNGNGNVASPSAVNETGERFQFWRQLAHAGLIEGSFSGVADGSSNTALTATNSPVPRVASAGGWGTLWRGPSPGNSSGSYSYFTGDYGNFFFIGTGTTIALLFKPEEAWNIDTKWDDGRPALGRVLSTASSTCSGASNVTDTSVNYALSETSQSCGIYFLRVY